MSAYLIIEATPTDQENWQRYEAGALQVAARHGGEPLARDTAPLPIERTDEPAIGVVMRFPDKQAVRDYFADPAYVPLRALRHSAARASALVIEA